MVTTLVSVVAVIASDYIVQSSKCDLLVSFVSKAVFDKIIFFSAL